MILPADERLDPAPAELQQHHLAALSAAAWALLGFAATPKDERLAHRAAAALGLSDGLAGREASGNVAGSVELEAYLFGHRAGLIVRTGKPTL